MVLTKFHKCVLNAKNDFLINASKIVIFLITNISLTLLQRQRPNNLRHTLFYATRILENVVFLYTVQKQGQ